MMFRLAIGLAAAMLSTAASAETFHLVCLGGGAANRPTVATAYGFNSSGQSATAQVFGQRDVGFEDQVNIEIIDGVGKIRMPRAMLPTLRGGKDGWFELENLKIGEKEITGNAAVNFINSPKVRIDRITGMLALSGKSGDFAAQCRPYDPEKIERVF